MLHVYWIKILNSQSLSWTKQQLYIFTLIHFAFGIDDSILNHPWLPGTYKTQVTGHKYKLLLYILRLVWPISILFIIIKYFFISVIN